MTLAFHPDGRVLEISAVTDANPRQERTARAAIDAARAELPGCAPLAVRWFRGDSSIGGYVHPRHPGTVYLWAGLRPAEIRPAARHETFHAWARQRGIAHGEADARAFEAGPDPERILRLLVGNEPIHVSR